MSAQRLFSGVVFGLSLAGNLWPGIQAGVVVAALLAFVVERVVFQRIYEREQTFSRITSFGILLGGLGSIKGTLYSSLLVGQVVSPGWLIYAPLAVVAPFAVMLLVRPTGQLGGQLAKSPATRPVPARPSSPTFPGPFPDSTATP